MSGDFPQYDFFSTEKFLPSPLPGSVPQQFQKAFFSAEVFWIFFDVSAFCLKSAYAAVCLPVPVCFFAVLHFFYDCFCLFSAFSKSFFYQSNVKPCLILSHY